MNELFRVSFRFSQRFAPFSCLFFREGLKEVNPYESAHGIAVIYSIRYAFIGQVEPALQQIHPKHDFDLDRRPAAFPRGVVRHDQGYSLLPRDDLVHDLQKFFPLCFLLPATVFRIDEAFLFHFLSPPFSLILSLPLSMWGHFISSSLYSKTKLIHPRKTNSTATFEFTRKIFHTYRNYLYFSEVCT